MIKYLSRVFYKKKIVWSQKGKEIQTDEGPKQVIFGLRQDGVLCWKYSVSNNKS